MGCYYFIKFLLMMFFSNCLGEINVYNIIFVIFIIIRDVYVLIIINFYLNFYVEYFINIIDLL